MTCYRPRRILPSFSRGPFSRDFSVAPGNEKSPVKQGFSHKAGDRDRTGDIQLGKLTFYR